MMEGVSAPSATSAAVNTSRTSASAPSPPLINDLLDLKIEAGKLELTFAGVALNDLTQQCVAIMQPQPTASASSFTSLPPTLPQVIADALRAPDRAQSPVNSIKFTGAGGRVIVSTALSSGSGPRACATPASA